MAERTGILAYMILTAFISGILFSISVRWTWGGGWIAQLDPPFHDFAGSAVVHLLGGAAAFAGSSVVGARLGRWEDPMEFLPHSIPQVLSGVLLLWIGWCASPPSAAAAICADPIYGCPRTPPSDTLSAPCRYPSRAHAQVRLQSGLHRSNVVVR
jgi:Amt family ammonium transporter